MPYEARVYRILIASPSDVKEEKDIAVQVIQEWNNLHSYSRKIVLLPLRWETHIAPEYGVRPQEIINRTIVDQCDLLVGIFWTRLGSPTGEFESGTIEEIQRAAKLKKPVMIYFSQREIRPESIDTAQLEKLRKFQEEISSIALIETYNSPYEFKEKFTKSLELKIKELHEKSVKDETYFEFGLFSIENETIQSQYTWSNTCLKVINIGKLSKNEQNRLKELINQYNNYYSYCPLVFAIKNLAPVSLQNLYIELEIFSDSKNLNITDNIQETSYFTPLKYYNPAGMGEYLSTIIWTPIVYSYTFHKSFHPILEKINNILLKYKPKNLHRTEKTWKISFELNVLQPQRLQILEPVLYIKTMESSFVSIKSKIYTDLFYKPYEFHLNLKIEVTHKEIKFEDLDPRWIKYVKEGK